MFLDAVGRVDEWPAVERVDDDGDVGGAGPSVFFRLDHERAVQSAAHLRGRCLVGVVPERSDLVSAEPVGVAPARRDRILRHAGDAILAVR